MNTRLLLAVGGVLLGFIVAVSLITLPGVQLMPMCCVRRYAMAALVSARPMCAVLLPFLPQMRRAARP